MIIRPETEADIHAIEEITKLAFKDEPYSEQTEHLIVNELRKSGALSVSLVAEIDGELVGHVAFSPVEISDNTKNWYGLGPVSVHPDFQKQGIGSALIQDGLEKIQALGAAGCVVLGEPAYYTNFGFEVKSNLSFEGAPAEYFMNQSFSDNEVHGQVSYHKAFFVQA